ncbi:hypothetical protein MTO96_029440 [Rhipicephalus appendiculatus]
MSEEICVFLPTYPQNIRQAGQPSSDPTHPDNVPTVFPYRNQGNMDQKLQRGLLELVEEGYVFLVERGFRCKEMFGALGASLLMPSLTKKRAQLPGAEPVVGGAGAAASSAPSALCIICTMVISMIVASVLTFFIIDKNRTIVEATTTTTTTTTRHHVPFPQNDSGALDVAEEDRVTSGDLESTVTEDT